MGPGQSCTALACSFIALAAWVRRRAHHESNGGTECPRPCRYARAPTSVVWKRNSLPPKREGEPRNSVVSRLRLRASLESSALINSVDYFLRCLRTTPPFSDILRLHSSKL